MCFMDINWADRKTAITNITPDAPIASQQKGKHQHFTVVLSLYLLLEIEQIGYILYIWLYIGPVDAANYCIFISVYIFIFSASVGP